LTRLLAVEEVASVENECPRHILLIASSNAPLSLQRSSPGGIKAAAAFCLSSASSQNRPVLFPALHSAAVGKNPMDQGNRYQTDIQQWHLTGIIAVHNVQQLRNSSDINLCLHAYASQSCAMACTTDWSSGSVSTLNLGADAVTNPASFSRAFRANRDHICSAGKSGLLPDRFGGKQTLCRHRVAVEQFATIRSRSTAMLKALPHFHIIKRHFTGVKRHIEYIGCRLSSSLSLA